MRSATLRRLGAAVISPALAAGMLAAAPPALAADNAPEAAAAQWLAAQPGSDGLFTGYYADFETGAPVAFTDYGLNLDLYTALAGLGQTARAETVYTATIAKADDYTDAYGTRYAGAVGKLAATIQAHGDDAATAVSGRDLIADLETLVVDDGAEKGRAKDAPDGPYQSTNVLNQGWAVRALAGADSDEAPAAIDYLLAQQCDDGSFRENVSSTPCTTGPGSVDGTSFAIQSLAIAANAGATGLQDDISAAGDWLVGVQAADGSFTDAGAANTNSTGLAAAALALTGHPTDADEAARWVADRQVGTGPDAGAIALDDADRAAAEGATIDNLDRDRYVRASVQAVLGLSAILPSAQLAVTAPARYVRAGSAVTVRVAGLVPRETFAATMGGGTSARGTADAAGRATASLSAPTSGGSRTVTVVGARPGREGAAAVTVLAARRLPTATRSTAVRTKARQQLVVRGLQPGEPFQIRYRGRQIATGTANSAGRVVHSFRVGGSKGRKTVAAYGLFTGRKGAATFRVR